MIRFFAAAVLQLADGGALSPSAQLSRLASRLEPTIESSWVREWLNQAHRLRPLKPTTWYCSKTECFSSAREGLEPQRIDEALAYLRVADPLGYARTFEIASRFGFVPRGKKVLDFGYGNWGHLLMLAELGVEVHGIEVDPRLVAVSKQLRVRRGSFHAHHGFFASDPKLVASLGDGYDLWFSKNTLKRGYVHPAQEGTKAQIDLGVSDEAALELIASKLKPQGLFIIYNLAPTPTSTASPMADGRCPFARAAFENAGFDVVAYDVDDSKAARVMARALEWNRDWPQVDGELVATFTVARRR